MTDYKSFTTSSKLERGDEFQISFLGNFVSPLCIFHLR